jgi:integrase
VAKAPGQSPNADGLVGPRERQLLGFASHRIGLHEGRHTAVSHGLEAGIAIEKVSKFIGHTAITVTIDRYGHLLPGGEAEAAALLDE